MFYRLAGFVIRARGSSLVANLAIFDNLILSYLAKASIFY
jgi:hypothetical protein